MIRMGSGISLASEPGRLALAVPPLGEVDEQIPHGARQAEPVGQHLRDLAQRGEVALVSANRPREPAGDLQGAHRQAALSGLASARMMPRHRLDRRPEHHRRRSA